MIGKRFGLNWQKSSEKVNNQKKGKKMKKQNRNRLSKKDRRLIKKAMLKAAAKGCDEVYRIAEGLKDGFELLGRKDG